QIAICPRSCKSDWTMTSNFLSPFRSGFHSVESLWKRRRLTAAGELPHRLRRAATGNARMQINFLIGRKRETAPPPSIQQRANEVQAALDARMRGEPDPTAANERPWWYLLLAALFMFGLSGLAARGSIGLAIVNGVGGLAALFAANKMRLKQGATAKVKRI